MIENPMIVWMTPTIAAMIFWGLGQGLVKKYIEDVSPARFCLYYILARSLVMGCFYLYSYAQGEVTPLLAPEARSFLLFGLLSYTLDGIAWILYYESIISGPITIVGTISAAYPALTIIFAKFFLDEQISSYQMLGVLMVIVSCIGLSIPSEHQITERVKHGRWVPLAITALLLWGVAGTTVKYAYLLTGSSESNMSLLGISGGMLTLGLYGLLKGKWRKGEGQQQAPGEWKRSALPMAVMGSGDLGVLIAYRTGPTSIVTPISAAYPVITLGFARLFLKEKITKLQWVFVVMIIIGVFMTSLGAS
ncbi:MAG: DMT family transporter [Deltaproteobacteria bacterium]|nr:DMT family transporter [Deltaproteobacteria bacterium]